MHRFFFAGLAGAALLLSSVSEANEKADEFAAAAAERLSAYIQINTQNPPGNETRGAEFFASILDAAGIAYQTAESAPGRGNIWARLEGGDKPALVLLNHMDVVPADLRYWSFNPFSGAIRDGHVYGRGALDLSLIHISEPTRPFTLSRMPSSA